MPGWVALLTRVLNGIFDAINKHNVEKAVDNPADTLANGGELYESDQTFAELSAKAKRYKAE
jgi:hypothetical protein